MLTRLEIFLTSLIELAGAPQLINMDKMPSLHKIVIIYLPNWSNSINRIRAPCYLQRTSRMELKINLSYQISQIARNNQTMRLLT
jgi:hypothetical protein